MLQGVLPVWVEADPLRARATDALGLQAVADRLADRLLPGLSVLTTRARYFTFLAWARERIGKGHDERAIHRWEVALALAEAKLSDENQDHAKDCRFIGSRNVGSLPRDRNPTDPRQVYKVPAWRAYRASIIALGLIEGAPHYSLTDEGIKAAKFFQVAVRPRGPISKPLPGRACLSTISPNERRLLRHAIGLSIRGHLDTDASDLRKRWVARRAAFAREVRDIFDRDGLSPESVLPLYESRRKRDLDEPIATLQAAAIWERLSVGLNTIFTAWIRSIDRGQRRATERRLVNLLRHNYPPPKKLEAVSLAEGEEDSVLARAIASLRYGLRLHDDLRDRGVSLSALDEQPFDLARALVKSGETPRKQVEDMLMRLVARHRDAKGDESWIREASHGEFELVRDPDKGWTVPDIVRPHAYRMTAFNQVARDLGGLRREKHA